MTTEGDGIIHDSVSSQGVMPGLCRYCLIVALVFLGHDEVLMLI